MAYRIGVDTGGTFTDFVVLDEAGGPVHTLKLPSTPHDPSAAVAAGLAALQTGGSAAVPLETGTARWSPPPGVGGGGQARPAARDALPLSAVSFFSHGTTVATNALLEEKGARVGLLVTRGFRGIYEVMDQTRGHGRSVYDLYFTKPRLLAPERLTAEIEERVDARGEVLTPLDEAQARRSVAELLAKDLQAVAVCLLFSFLNPAHERRVGELVRELAPEVHVSLSCEVLPRIREYFRLSTTVVNAYVQPLMAGYLGRLAAGLGDAGVGTPRRYVMQSTGGVGTFAATAARPVTTILSGPAAGAIAAARVATAAGYSQAIGFDMGGTSADIALIVGGRAAETAEGKVAGRDLALPMLDIHTLSAGGGTLARVDELGVLHVGPDSAGAAPGPACYGRGGERPTVTDANVALGLLPSDTQLGGRLALRPELARQAIEAHVARPLGIPPDEAAEAILRVVNARMEAGIRRVSTERGHDLRDFTLVAFGGAGPLHAGALCRDLGIPRFLVPAHPGLTSALGLLLADVTRDFLRSRLSLLAPGDETQIAAAFEALEAEARDALTGEGFAAWRRERLVELRYAGQGYELPVPWEPDEDAETLRRRFDDLHEQRFGHRAPEAPVEVVTYRLTARVPVAAAPPSRPLATRPADPLRQARVRLPEIPGPLSVPVYDRHAVGHRQALQGPAILVQADATTVLYPQQTATADEDGNLIVSLAGGEAS